MDWLPEKEKDRFRQASKTIDPRNLLMVVKQYDDDHQHMSSFRPHADSIARFLSLLDRFMGGVAIGIQASPDISSLVVGGVRVIIDVVVRFVEYFDRFTAMLCRFENWLQPLEEYCLNISEDDLVLGAVANVYGDLLKFCYKACNIFTNPAGSPISHTTVRAFFRVQWKGFEDDFGKIEQNVLHHMNVLLHSATASQSVALRNVTALQHRTIGQAEGWSSLKIGKHCTHHIRS